MRSLHALHVRPLHHRSSQKATRTDDATAAAIPHRPPIGESRPATLGLRAPVICACNFTNFMPGGSAYKRAKTLHHFRVLPREPRTPAQCWPVICACNFTNFI
jgi:hypothetical protein